MTTLQIDRIRQLADIIQAQPHTPMSFDLGIGSDVPSEDITKDELYRRLRSQLKD